MDNITQWVIWWAIYTLITWKQKTKSFITWAIVTNLPDLDIFLSKLLYTNQVDQFFFHRSITHSLLSWVLIWVIVWSILWYKNKWDIPLWRYVVAIICSVVFWHLMVDWFTTYGIRYFLPWGETFYSFDNMPIIDLIFLWILVILFFLYIIRLYKKQLSIAIISISTLRFAWSFMIKDMVKNDCNASFTKYGLEYNVQKVLKFWSFPKFGSLINWKCIYNTEDAIYVSDHNIFKNNDIAWSQVATHAPWSQQNTLKELTYSASWMNKVRIDKVIWWNRGYNYISKIWDNQYLIQNAALGEIWSIWHGRWWYIDTTNKDWNFNNKNDINISDIASSIWEDIIELFEIEKNITTDTNSSDIDMSWYDFVISETAVGGVSGAILVLHNIVKSDSKEKWERMIDIDINKDQIIQVYKWDVFDIDQSRSIEIIEIEKISDNVKWKVYFKTVYK